MVSIIIIINSSPIICILSEHDIRRSKSETETNVTTALQLIDIEAALVDPFVTRS